MPLNDEEELDSDDCWDDQQRSIARTSAEYCEMLGRRASVLSAEAISGEEGQGEPMHSGWLSKRNFWTPANVEGAAGWKRRWFQLHGGTLCYWREPPGADEPPVPPLGVLVLDSDLVIESTSTVDMLLCLGDRAHAVRSDNAAECAAWTAAIRQAANDAELTAIASPE